MAVSDCVKSPMFTRLLSPILCRPLIVLKTKLTKTYYVDIIDYDLDSTDTIVLSLVLLCGGYLEGS